DGKVSEQNWRAIVALFEHRVMPCFSFAPQTELGAQAVMLARRVEHLRFGGLEGGQQFTQACFFVGELGGVYGRVGMRVDHGRLMVWAEADVEEKNRPAHGRP